MKPRQTVDFLEQPTRYLFFTGKGGVGKTSLACASAIALADSGSKVLLVSTDPASNLDEALSQKLGPTAVQIPGVPGLNALNIDPEAAAQAYRDRMVGPYRGVLPDAVVRSMEEQLSGACTVEIAAFDEFAGLLGDPSATADYDHVIFDTAPTGHTLRLLALPGAWTGFLNTNSTGTSCLGPVSGLQKQRSFYEKSLVALSDARQTTVLLVTRPQKQALSEVERTSKELAALGMRNQRLIVNGVFHSTVQDDLGAALEQRGLMALEEKKQLLQSIPWTEIPLRSNNLIGVPALRELLSNNLSGTESSTGTEAAPEPGRNTSLAELVDELARPGRGVIMTMGKGGVGKTTLAAAIAAELARRGYTVHLSTTDPAAHVLPTVGGGSGFEVSRIDPQKETQAYVTHVMSTAGKGLDAKGRAVLEEDLRSPCTEEIAVFRAFARVVAQGESGFVVLDTAPTGHTLLLLDATEAYHREVSRKSSDMPEEVVKLLPRLRDPSFTRILLVTLPEATPVHEAAVLQEDLRRAQIEPFAWIVNQAFIHARTAEPLLKARGLGEVRFIHEVTERFSTRTILVPWVAREPVGLRNLQQLVQPSPIFVET
ncbi:MAG TPA: arsenical pump-driving ATPase [Verrucomicrobiae bacterium]|nr:arsenical pump-driving ATPase [Verrucomicrobiae bacterium]